MMCDDPLVAETRATFLTITKVYELGFDSVFLEGDSFLVVQAIQWLSSIMFWFIENAI